MCVFVCVFQRIFYFFDIIQWLFIQSIKKAWCRSWIAWLLSSLSIYLGPEEANEELNQHIFLKKNYHHSSWSWSCPVIPSIHSGFDPDGRPFAPADFLMNKFNVSFQKSFINFPLLAHDNFYRGSSKSF